MAIVAPGTRSTTFTTVSTTAGPFNIGFRLFDTDGLDVYLDGTRTTAFTITATFTDGFTDSATITFTAAVDVGTQVIIDGALTPRRAVDYLAGDAALTYKLNIELARLWSALSEVKRDSKRAVRGLEPLEATQDIDFEALLAASEQSAANLLGVFRGNWTTAAVYALGDRVFDATSGNGYQCLIAHTAGTFSTDVAAGRWGLYVQRGASGAGTGDLLSAQNLNDLADKAASRNNLGVTLTNLGLNATAAELNAVDGVTATGTALIRAADAATARATIVAPALPSNAAGLGEWTLVYAGDNATLLAPAGGTWANLLFKRAIPAGTINTIVAGVGAGGGTISFGAPGQDMFALVWRVA